MRPNSAADNTSSGGETREELAVIIEKSRATVDRLKRIIASQQQLLEIEKDLPAGHGDLETGRESSHMVINRLKEHRRELDALNAELEKYINELGRRASNRDITDLKQAEEALKLTQASVDLAANEIVWITPEGKIVYANEATCRALQRCRDELLRMYVWDIHPKYTREMWQERWQEIKKRGSLTFEAVHYAKDGREFPVEVSMNYVKSDGKEFNFAYIHDITDRMQAEEALRVSEERYRELVENANSIILRFDMRGNLTFFNEYAEKLFGYSKEELLGRNVMGTIVPSSESTGRDLDDIIEDIKRYPERYLSNVNENVFKNGDRVWIAWTNKAIRDEQGNVVEILSVGNDITERKRMEEALWESEARFSAFMDNSPGIAWMKDEEGIYVYLNKGCGELFGMGLDHGLWKTDHELFPPEVADRYREVDRGVLASGRMIAMEDETMGPDGRRVQWLCVKFPFKSASGKGYVGGIAIDITESKRAEEALRKSEASLVRSQAIAHLANWEMDVGTGRVRVSEEFYRIFNLEPGVPQESYGEKIHPGDRARILESVNATIYEGKPYSIDYRIVPRPGEVRHIHAEGETIRDRAGRPLSFFGTVQDITERMHAEEALRESEERLRRTSRAGQIGLYEWNEDLGTAYCSPEAYELLGLEPGSTVTYERFFERLHPDDREMFRRSSDEAREKAHNGSSGTAQGEFRVMHEDGAVLWLEATATYALEGGDVMVRGAVRDITERKRVEEELANAKAQAELYLDLMGHDINNFNQAARGYLELMDGMVEDEKLKELVSKPMEAIDGSSRLIQNVQMLRRARSGGNPAEVLDLGALVEEVAGQFKSLPDESVNITCDAVKGIVVRANELLRDVFVNLVGNAIKHSAGPACVNICVMPEEKDGQGHCRVTIDDNGPGVPDDMKEKIFNRLSRGNTKAKGSGLGLYLVKSLVESYGGRVWAEDRVPGDHTQGARFVVILPSVNE